MERTAQCHCGSLRVIASGEPERVYVCHCRACQHRTRTAFHSEKGHEARRTMGDRYRGAHKRRTPRRRARVCRRKWRRDKVYLGHAERAISVRRNRNSAPPSIWGKRAVGIHERCSWLGERRLRRLAEARIFESGASQMMCPSRRRSAMVSNLSAGRHLGEHPESVEPPRSRPRAGRPGIGALP